MRFLSGVPAAVVIGVFVASAFLLGRRSVRPTGSALAQVETLTVEVAAFDSSEAIRARANAAARQRVAASDALTRAAIASAAVDSAAADSLRGVLDTAQIEADSLRRLAQALDSTRQREADSLRSALATLRGTLGVALERWAAADSAASSAQALLHDALRRLQIVARMTRRCGLGGSAGYALNTKGAGPGASVGVACRL